MIQFLINLIHRIQQHIYSQKDNQKDWEKIHKEINKEINKEKFERQIAKASESWNDVDVDDFMTEIRGYDIREQNNSE